MTSQRKAMMVNACPRCGDHHWKLHQYNDKQAVYLCDNVECTYPLDSPDLPLLLVDRCARAAALKRILKKKASAVQESEDLDPSPSTEQTYLTALPRSAQLEAILNKYKRKAESIDSLLTLQETHGKRRRKHCKTSESTHNPSVEVISQAQCRVDEVPQMTTNESADNEALDVQVLSVKTCRNYTKGNVAHRVTSFGNVSAIKKEVEPLCFTPINTKSDSSESSVDVSFVIPTKASRISSSDVLAAGDVALDKHHFRNSAKTIPRAIDNNSHAVIDDVKHLSKSNDTTDGFVTGIKLPVSIDEQSISDSPTEPIRLETSKNTHDSNSSAVVDSKSKAISCTTSTTTTTTITSNVSKAPSASNNVEDNDLKAQHCLLNDTSTKVEPSHVLFADTNVENIIEPSVTSSNSANKTSAINSMDSFVPFIEETPSECNDDVIEETVFTIEHSTDSDQPPSDCTIAFTNSTLVLNNDVQKEEKCDSVTEQCIQWQNRDSLCWLDVLLCMLAHSVVLRQVVLARIISTANQKKFVKNSSIIKLLESYDDAMDSYFPDSSALDRLSGTSQSSDSYMSMKTGGGGVGTITDLDTGALHDFMNSYDQHVSLVKQQELEKTGKQEAMKILDKIRDEIFCTLQQRRFKCMKGVHNSPVNAMPYLIEKEPRDIQDVFSVQYFSQLKCTNCKRTSNSKKITTAVIPIICNTSTDFDAAAPSFVERCGKCQKHRQLTTYVYKRVPPILTLHFHQGLEYKCLKDLDFTISSVTYRLSAIVVHLAKPDHFFVWIRHSKEDWWMLCDGLRQAECTYSKLQPEIPSSQIVIVQWERQGSLQALDVQTSTVTNGSSVKAESSSTDAVHMASEVKNKPCSFTGQKSTINEAVVEEVNLLSSPDIKQTKARKAEDKKKVPDVISLIDSPETQKTKARIDKGAEKTGEVISLLSSPEVDRTKDNSNTTDRKPVRDIDGVRQPTIRDVFIESVSEVPTSKMSNASHSHINLHDSCVDTRVLCHKISPSIAATVFDRVEHAKKQKEKMANIAVHSVGSKTAGINNEPRVGHVLSEVNETRSAGSYSTPLEPVKIEQQCAQNRKNKSKISKAKLHSVDANDSVNTVHQVSLENSEVHVKQSASVSNIPVQPVKEQLANNLSMPVLPTYPSTASTLPAKQKQSKSKHVLAGEPLNKTTTKTSTNKSETSTNKSETSTNNSGAYSQSNAHMRLMGVQKAQKGQCMATHGHGNVAQNRQTAVSPGTAIKTEKNKKKLSFKPKQHVMLEQVTAQPNVSVPLLAASSISSLSYDEVCMTGLPGYKLESKKATMRKQHGRPQNTLQSLAKHPATKLTKGPVTVSSTPKNASMQQQFSGYQSKTVGINKVKAEKGKFSYLAALQPFINKCSSRTFNKSTTKNAKFDKNNKVTIGNDKHQSPMKSPKKSVTFRQDPLPSPLSQQTTSKTSKAKTPPLASTAVKQEQQNAELPDELLPDNWAEFNVQNQSIKSEPEQSTEVKVEPSAIDNSQNFLNLGDDLSLSADTGHADFPFDLSMFTGDHVDTAADIDLDFFNAL